MRFFSAGAVVRFLARAGKRFDQRTEGEKLRIDARHSQRLPRRESVDVGAVVSGVGGECEYLGLGTRLHFFTAEACTSAP